MNNPQKIYDFLKSNSRQLFCDDCIQKKTGVDRHEINTIARTLALFPKDFRRMSTACSQRCSNRDKESTEALSS
jgi:hypothetical protein